MADNNWFSDFLDSISDTANEIYTNPVQALSGYAANGIQNLIPGTGGDDNDLLQSEYDFNYRTFPEDIGNEDVAHYMVININVPVTPGGSTPRTALNFGGNVLPGDQSKVDVLRFGSTVSGQGQQEAILRPRYTRRIRESIALHMPATMTHTSFNDYPDISLTALGGGLLTGAAKLAVGGLGAFAGSIIGGPAGAAQGANIGSTAIDGISQYLNQAARIAGYPINPRVEVLFASTRQRQYMFEVIMAPRNKREAATMTNIIRTLRYHAAPEIDPLTSGFTFIPPAEFDITFFHKGKENLNIPRVNTCVMERIDVDYAPFGGNYTTHHDGTPVGVRLSMGFREIEIVHKLRVAQGF